MITTAKTGRVFVLMAPCDMRKQYDSLAALVRLQMGKDLLTGDLFLFVGKNRRRAKLLWFDGTGLCLLAKRLEKHRFVALWEHPDRCELTVNELALFLEGSEVVGRVPLSPPPWVPSDNTLRFD